MYFRRIFTVNTVVSLYSINWLYNGSETFWCYIKSRFGLFTSRKTPFCARCLGLSVERITGRDMMMMMRKIPACTVNRNPVGQSVSQSAYRSIKTSTAKQCASKEARCDTMYSVNCMSREPDTGHLQFHLIWDTYGH